MISLTKKILHFDKECFSGLYGTNEGSEMAEDIAANCSGEHVMFGCRPVGSETWQLVGFGNSDNAFTDTGTRNGVVTVDGDIQWYYNDDWSMGFSPAGISVDKFQCDVAAGPLRMCWHTLNFGVGGYRCGNNRELNYNLNWERSAWTKDECSA
jgi:hypothetical protein